MVINSALEMNLLSSLMVFVVSCLILHGQELKPLLRGFDQELRSPTINVGKVRSMERLWYFPGSMTLDFTGAFPQGYESNLRIAGRSWFLRLEFYYATGKVACMDDQGLAAVREEALKSKMSINNPENKVRFLCELEYDFFNGAKNKCSAKVNGIKDADSLKSQEPQRGCILIGCSMHVEGHDSQGTAMYEDTPANRALREQNPGWNDVAKELLIQHCDAMVKAQWLQETDVPKITKNKIKHMSPAGAIVTTTFWVAVAVDLLLLLCVLVCSIKACKYLNGESDDNNDETDSY